MVTIVRRDTTAGNTSNVAAYASASFTPTVGDLLVVLANVAGTTTAAPTCTASANGITFTLFDVQAHNVSANRLYRFVANQTVGASPAAMTVTVNTGADAGTGALITVLGAQGMSKVGAAAIRQFTGADNNHATGGTTPSVTLAQAPLTTNPVVAHTGNLTGTGTGLTPPSGWTEYSDASFSTPTTGMEVCGIASGFTGTTITAGSTMTVGAIGAFELDASTESAIPTGTATGTLTFSGTATGKRTPAAVAGGTLTFTGTATGVTVRRGTAGGALAFVGSAAGKRTPKGSSNGTLAFVGTSTGKRTPKAAGSGSLTFTGAAAGDAPTAGAAEGAASGSLTFTGTATGKRQPKATTVGTLSLTGTATGARHPAAITVGTLGWVGTATGTTPAQIGPGPAIAATGADSRRVTVDGSPPRTTAPAESRTTEAS